MSSMHRLDTSTPTDTTIGWKKGVRVLGVAESFEKKQSHSILAGVVMRGDFRIDGFGRQHGSRISGHQMVTVESTG